MSPRGVADPQLGAALLAAAEAILVEDGVAALSVRQVAARAGVADGALYNHFSGKDALLEAVLDRRLQEADDRLREALRAVGSRPDGAAVLEALAEGFLAALPFVGLAGGSSGARVGHRAIEHLVARRQCETLAGRAAGDDRRGAATMAALLVAAGRQLALERIDGTPPARTRARDLALALEDGGLLRQLVST